MLWANGKGGFFRVENKTSISRWEWIIRSAHASCKLTRMFLRLFWLNNMIARKTLYSGIELICEFLRQWFIITKTCFDGFLLFLLVWWVCKSFWKESLTRTIRSFAARALSSPSRCFQLSTNLDKDLFRYLLCWDAVTNFTNAKKATNIMSVSSTQA